MNIETRQKIEKKITKEVIKNLLDYGLIVEIYADGDMLASSLTDTHTALTGVCMDLDQCEVIGKLYTSPKPFCWLLMVYGNDGHDCIADYTINTMGVIKSALDLADRLEQEYC